MLPGPYLISAATTASVLFVALSAEAETKEPILAFPVTRVVPFTVVPEARAQVSLLLPLREWRLYGYEASVLSAPLK